MQTEKGKRTGNHSESNTAGRKPGIEENVAAAHEQADKDMEQDADLSIHSPNDDLDEGETARLGEDTNELI